MSDPKDDQIRDDTTPPEHGPSPLAAVAARIERLKDLRFQAVAGMAYAPTIFQKLEWAKRARQCDVELTQLEGAGQ